MSSMELRRISEDQAENARSNRSESPRANEEKKVREMIAIVFIIYRKLLTNNKIKKM